MPSIEKPDETAIKAAFKDGPLGILMTRVENKPILDDLLLNANALGIEVVVFFMDNAIELLADAPWVESLPQGNYSGCETSAARRSVKSHPRITLAGQYHNALMVHDAAHLVSL